MSFLGRFRILAAAIVLALLGATWVGGAPHAVTAAAAMSTAGCDHCGGDEGDETPANSSCDFTCNAATAILSPSATPSMSLSNDRLVVLFASTSGLFASPDPYPPRRIA